jgi:DNA (cytosine-5)-methyltransferase 1
MNYASVCDGIGAVHVAWKPFGWQCAWTSEIEPFPAAVVEHHHGLTNLGDMTAITEETLNGVAAGPIDLLVGGTPCQSFSVAGLRRGLDDPRGNLALRFLQLAGVLRPTWVVWENVPGVLSSAGGRDFGTFLGALGELGYGFAYRVLDAQWFGVAQRRRRVFVVAHARDWRCAAAVLFERESLCGNPPSRGQARKDVAGSLVARSARNGRASNADVDAGQLIFGGNNQSGPIDVAPSCLAHGSPHGRQDFASEAFVVSDDPTHAICANEQRTYTNEGNVFQLRNVVAQPVAFSDKATALRARDQSRGVDSDCTDTLVGRSVAQPFAFAVDTYNQAIADVSIPVRVGNGKDSLPAVAVQAVAFNGYARQVSDTAWPVMASDAKKVEVGTMQGMAVRRLTPRECERLQGFPDDYTAITFKNKPAADGPRYKSLGNSMAVPVMRWIGERIALVEKLVP